MAKHLEVELESLKDKMYKLTALIEKSVQMAVMAIQDMDKERANSVVTMDDKIDDLEVEIEEDCLKILALYQPVAIDLRYIIGVLKMNNDLERIGDLAVNIAERSLSLIKLGKIDAPFELNRMAAATCSMLKRAILSLITMDTELAKKVCHDDQEVDDMNREMYQKIFTAIKKDPENVEALIQYLAASRNLERIGDYCTNIAEDLVYMVDGRIVRHKPEFFE